MVWIVLGLGASLPLLLATPLVWWRRRCRALHAAGVFACKVRERRACSWEPFPRRVSAGWWVGGVLAVHSGAGPVRTRLVPVVAGEGPRSLVPARVRGLGRWPRSLVLLTGDDRLIEVAVADHDLELLAGPLTPRQPLRRP
jgi:hypothetical protein